MPKNKLPDSVLKFHGFFELAPEHKNGTVEDHIEKIVAAPLYQILQENLPSKGSKLPFHTNL